jgi:sec-independent protein translocase protein TatC
MTPVPAPHPNLASRGARRTLTMSQAGKIPDPDDFFAETRMSFGDHIEELRWHLVRAIAGFLIGLVLSMFIGHWVLAFIAKPVEDQLAAFYDRREAKLRAEYLAKIAADPEAEPARVTAHDIKLKNLENALVQLGVPVPRKSGGDQPEWVPWETRVPRAQEVENFAEMYKKLGPRPTLKTLSVTEAFVVWFKVCIVTGLVISSPWVFYQIWGFVAAGLYPQEKKYVNVYLPFSILLFALGVLMSEFIVIPRSVEALLWFNEWLNLDPDLRLNEWLSFAIWVPVIFGLAFQTPLVMMFMERIGVGSVEGFRKRRRLVWFIMAVLCAVFTPTPDPYTMLFLWVPMCFFYELGIWLCLMSPSRSPLDLDVPESEEMVEV